MKTGGCPNEFYTDSPDFAGKWAAWEASALPLSYTRLGDDFPMEIRRLGQSVLRRFYFAVREGFDLWRTHHD